MFQRVVKPSRHDEFPMHPFHTLQALEKWFVDFIIPINPKTKNSNARYLIRKINYLTHWDEVEVVQDCFMATKTQFIFDNVITRFGCLRNLTSDQGAHFLSETIETLTIEFFYLAS